MSEGSFSVIPGSNEYTTLGFLVARCGRRFSPDEIAAHTDISATKVSNGVAQLVEWGLVQQAATDFYVDSDQAEEIRQRLRSLDTVVQIFETAPTDDAYAESGWADEVPSLSVDQDNRS